MPLFHTNALTAVIVYIVFLVLNWLSNLEFWRPKKKDQVAQIGIFSIEAFAYVFFGFFLSYNSSYNFERNRGNLWRQEGYMSVKYCKWCTFSGKFWKVEDFPGANYLTNSIAVFTWVIRKLLMETIDYRPTINGKFMKKSMKNEIFTHNKNAAGILRPYEIHIWKRMIFSFLSYFSMADFFCEHYKWVWAKEKSVTDISS